MAINFNQLLKTVNSGLQFGSQLLPRKSGANTSFGGLNIPTNLLGAGLTAGGLLADKEPGEVTQARQFLRNQFTSPTATSQLQGQAVTGAQSALSPLLGQVGPTGPGQKFLTNIFQNPQGLTQNLAATTSAAAKSFQPLLDQQRQRGIEEISQRFASAFPSSVGAQGPEFGTLARFITDEALPREQAFLGQLGLDLQNRQQSAAGSVFQDEANRRTQVGNLAQRGIDIPLDAAGSILDTSRPDPLAQLASLVGSNLLFNQGQGGQQGVQGQSTLLSRSGQQLGQVNQQTGQLDSAGDVVSQIGQSLASGNLQQLGQLLSSGALAGTPFPFGIEASTQAGQLVQQAINAGLVESPAATVVGEGAAAAGGGIGGALSTASGALAAGTAGFFVGSKIGDAIESPGSSATGFKTAAGGALSGAAAGAIIGSIVPGIGTVIGAIIGGIAGAFGGSGAERRREDAQLEQERAETNTARPQAIQNAQQLVTASQQAEAQFRDQRPALKQAVSKLIQQGDPEVTAMIKNMFALQQESSSAQGIDSQTSLGSSVPRANIFGHTDTTDRQAAQLVEFIMTGLGRGSAFTPGTPGHDLLNSTETGKFGPGANRIEREISNLQTAQQLASQLLQIAQRAGV